MARLLAFIIMVGCFFLLFKSRWIWMMQSRRRKGCIPAKGKATMFHVKDLITNGEKELAVELYCEIFQTSRSEAQKAVMELENSILNKNS